LLSHGTNKSSTNYSPLTSSKEENLTRDLAEQQIMKTIEETYEKVENSVMMD